MTDRQLPSPRTPSRRSRLGRLLDFPSVVNEVAVRIVAAGIALTATLAVATGQLWLALPLAYGFVARTLAGPRFSPWALLVTRVVVPRLSIPERPVAGQPKRFAQGMGATFTVLASISHFALGWSTPATLLLAGVAVAATLEAAFAFCIGCRIFGLLISSGILSPSACEACSRLDLR